MENIKDASIAGLVARLCTHPIDTVRIRIQTNDSPFSVLQIIKSTFQKEGMYGFYKGWAVASGFSVPALAVYLSSYDYFKSLHEKETVVSHASSAFLAELLSAFLWTPMEVLKMKQQFSTSHKPTKSLIREIYVKDGISGFFRGYWMGLCVFIPHSVIRVH